MNAEETA